MENRKIKLVGDSHGRNQVIFDLCERNKDSIYISMGDQGWGFPIVRLPDQFPSNYLCLFGNHDNPSYKSKVPYLGDFGYNEELDLFYISGAWSIDWQMRTPGLSWWEDEELSQPVFDEMLKLYKEVRPKRVISHDCPLSMYHYLDLFGGIIENRTNIYLEKAFNIHQPDEWYFGHFHSTMNINIRGTEFRCLRELEVLEI